MRRLIPNTPADIVQDLYLREIKAYKPAPAVSHCWDTESDETNSIVIKG